MRENWLAALPALKNRAKLSRRAATDFCTGKLTEGQVSPVSPAYLFYLPPVNQWEILSVKSGYCIAIIFIILYIIMMITSIYERKEHFLNLLAETGSVMTSAKRAGLSKQLVYHYRKCDPEFAADWDDILSDRNGEDHRQRPRRTILTEPVKATRSLFIIACERALQESGMNREEAAGQLSSLLSDLWNLLERKALRLPAPREQAKSGATAQNEDCVTSTAVACAE